MIFPSGRQHWDIWASKVIKNRNVNILESARERIPRSVLRGKRANGEHNYSLWIEDSPQFTSESFNPASASADGSTLVETRM